MLLCKKKLTRIFQEHLYGHFGVGGAAAIHIHRYLGRGPGTLQDTPRWK